MATTFTKQRLKAVLTSVSDRVLEQPWSNPLLFAIAGGLAAVIVFGAKREHPLTAAAVGLLVAGAALAVGAAIGFLFAIPRAVQEPAERRGALAQFETPYQVNTNLEQISDWLTKIVVGLGLVEITKIPAAFTSLAVFVATAFGEPAVPPSVAGVIISYFAVGGFLVFYIWTRLLLTYEFTRADRAARQSPEFYEGLIEALLYQPPPRGYETALEVGEEFLKRFGEGNWRVWRALACAHGQKYSYLKADDKTAQPELDLAREQALKAVKRVLALNPGETDSMRTLWDPKRVTPEENDLEVFYNDDPTGEFKKLLGEPGGTT